MYIADLYAPVSGQGRPVFENGASASRVEAPKGLGHRAARDLLFAIRQEIQEKREREPKVRQIDRLLIQCEDRICHRDAALNGLLSAYDESLLNERDRLFLDLASCHLRER